MEAAAAARRAAIAKERADEEARLEALIAERVAEIQRLEEVVYRAPAAHTSRLLTALLLVAADCSSRAQGKA